MEGLRRRDWRWGFDAFASFFLGAIALVLAMGSVCSKDRHFRGERRITSIKVVAQTLCMRVYEVGM